MLSEIQKQLKKDLLSKSNKSADEVRLLNLLEQLDGLKPISERLIREFSQKSYFYGGNAGVCPTCQRPL